MKAQKLILCVCSLFLAMLGACGMPTAADEDPYRLEGVTATPHPWPAYPPDTFPITQPPDEPFVPPEPFPTEPLEGQFRYGTAQLWTALPIDGRWHSLPYREDAGYTQKVVFWNENYDWQTEPQPDLTLAARRLDGEAPALATDHATNGYHPDYGAFMLTGVEVPTLGCWEFTARYGESELSFVVWVAP